MMRGHIHARQIEKRFLTQGKYLDSMPRPGFSSGYRVKFMKLIFLNPPYYFFPNLSLVGRWLNRKENTREKVSSFNHCVCRINYLKSRFQKSIWTFLKWTIDLIVHSITS